MATNTPAPTDTNQPTSTNGWDCVSVLRFPDVNAAIIKQKSSPPSFSESDTDPTFGLITFNGNFGDWQLSGGDGKLVWIDMPLNNSLFSMLNKTHSYPKTMQATVEVNMLWIEQATKPNATTSGFDLKVDPGVTINVENIDVGANTESDGSKISDVTIGIMKSSLQSWLIKNISQFDHVFASVDIAEQVDTDALGWLKPTDKFYAVTSSDTDPDNIDKMLFAVLCMTENRTNPGDHEVSPFAIPDGSRASFLISPERFMNKMMMNGLPLLFVGKSTIVQKQEVDPETGQTYTVPVETWADPVTVSDFTLANLAITNKVAMRFMTQQLDNKKTVDPVIAAGKFNLRFQTNGIELDLTDLNFDYTPGISVHINHTAPATLSIDSTRKFLLSVGNSTTSAQVVESEGVLIAEIVGSIAAAVIGSVVGGMIGGAAAGGSTAIVEGGTEAAVNTITVTSEEAAEGALLNVTEEAITESSDEATTAMNGISNGAANLSKFAQFTGFLARSWPKILGTIIGGAIGGSTGTIATIIKAVANDHTSVPTIDQLGTEALAPITWPNLDAKGFVVKEGGINGCLQIGFDITTS
jgi:Clostridium P-47 protein